MPRKPSSRRAGPAEDDSPKAITSYTAKLTDEQAELLETICDERVYGFKDVPYSLFAFDAPLEGFNLTMYQSGKLVVQGKGTQAFVQNILEPRVLKEARLGYEEVHHPEWYEPHAGLDEAGKGDLFGPLVSCCVIADGDAVRLWREKGVKDSKALTDGSIQVLEKIILSTKGVVVKKMWTTMPKYNEMMAKPRANLNTLLAWYHAKCLQKALEERTVPWGMVDQFSKQPLTQRQLKKDGVEFDLRMRTKAEDDPVVAAASICARAEFVRQLDKLSVEIGEPLRKGAGAPVKKQAQELVAKLGPHRLRDFAKVHFKTAYEVLGLPVPEKPFYKKRS